MNTDPAATSRARTRIERFIEAEMGARQSGRPQGQPTHARRPGWRTALGLLALAGAAWFGSMRFSTGPAAGSGLVPASAARDGTRRTQTPASASTSPARLRLACFNIHTGRGTDGREDLDRIARLLQGFDVVGLNEVRGPYWWEISNQANVLAERVHADWLFAPAERRWLYGEFGNAVLARLPCTSWQRIPLVRLRGKGSRNVLLVRLKWNQGPLNVLITHLDRQSDLDRREQLRTVGALFLALAEPAVLMGDLNTRRADPDLARLLATPGVIDPLAAADPNGPDHIDWILVRGLRPVAGGMVRTQASDHPLVWAELEYPAANKRQDKRP